MKGPVLAAALLACGGALPAAAEADFLDRARPFSIDALGAPAPDRSNRLSGRAAAIELGRALFHDTGLSRSGDVACASCHATDGRMIPNERRPAGRDRAFRPVSPIAGAAHQDLLMRDGSVDSLWAQALRPLEHASEHDLTRTEVVAYVAARHSDVVADLFDWDAFAVPKIAASPSGDVEARTAWTTLDPAARHRTNAMFADVGKAIASYVATIPVPASRWDGMLRRAARTPAGPDAVPAAVRRGFDVFTGPGRCATCHFGPLFSDGDFHNVAMPDAPDALPDLGRQAGSIRLLSDPFNCLGAFSDAATDECAALRFANLSMERGLGAFRTPSLRGVAARSSFGHAGRFDTLRAVVDHYVAAPLGPHGRMVGLRTASELVPLDLSEGDIADLIAFLELI
ncbi:cytochrome-c peroxidase [Jannaschia sp. LMIT008]|uniref:cytochrome-c peroxidase n=1 Tax=Jannaschia maritima TaxID=3032585 RepID=UPI002811773C|nr:cytochrome c peroxidase [Jannaschia sp. LMIT008]